MAAHGGLSRTPLFCPSVAAFPCGMLVNVPLFYDQLAPGAGGGAGARAALEAHYAGARLVAVRPPGGSAQLRRGAFLAPHEAEGGNGLELWVWDNPGAGTLLLTARLDNLGKGAAGQAVQNLNLLLGLDECAGL